jgi:hypothetical protein
MVPRIIKLEFTGNPDIGNAFSYDITIDGVPFLYPNGLTTLNLDYVAGNNIPYVSIGKKNTLTETIDATLNFLIEYYFSPNISYSRVENNIEILLNFDDAVVTYPDESSESILISDDAYNPNVNFKLKYLVEWEDAESVLYSVRIYQKGYTGTSTDVSGYGVLKYGSANNNLDAIRGNGLDLSLNATTDLTLEDLFTEDENSFSVKMYRKNKLLFDGFLKPDGVYQSFVQEQWIINLSCVDGLGLLKDLAFVQSNGLPFIGRQKAIDVIYNCLRRTGLEMNINTSVNIYYDGLTANDELDPLDEIYVSVDRFVKTDNDTIMDCNDVLNSILNLFNAVISQIDGQWYIYRPNELYDNAIVKFRQYSETNNSYIKLNTKNLQFNLGSQIDNYYPHHSGGNQQIEIKGSISAFRINYKYGFFKSIAENKYLSHTGYDYPGWTVVTQPLIVLDPLKNQGLITIPQLSEPTLPIIIKSNPVLFDINTVLDIKINAQQTLMDDFYDPVRDLWDPGFFFVKYQIKLDTSTTDYYLKFNGTNYEWTTTPSTLDFTLEKVLNLTFNLPALPVSGSIIISIYQAIKSFFEVLSNYEVTLVDIINKTNTDSVTGAIGEFHTVQRQNRPSSISKETTEIYNGDSPTLLYEGAIYKNNNTEATTVWFRKGKTENKAILRIAAEDILIMSQKPAKIFTGDIYGFMPYLSVISINNIAGKFMPIEWSFNAMTNVTSVKLLEIFNDDLTDIDYKYTLDYGNTTKVTITS